MKIVLKFAKSNIKHAKSKVLVLIICVAISCFIFAASLCVPRFIWNFNVDSMTAFYGNSDLFIAPEDMSVQRYSSMTYVPESTKNKCEYIYTIFAYQDYLSSASNDNLLLYNLIGVNYIDLINFNHNIQYEKNCAPSSMGELEVIISKSLANKYNLKFGDSVYLSKYKLSAKIVGIAKATGYFSDEHNIFTSKETIMRLMRTSGTSLMNNNNKNSIFNIAVVKVKPNYNVEDVREEFNNYLTNFVAEKTVDNELIQSYIDTVNAPFMFVATIVMVFCVFIILLVCNIIFTERLKEFATLKSIGATNGQLVSSLILESGAYGALGGLLGGTLTYLLAVVLEHTSMPFVRDIPFVFFVYMFLFGTGFAIISSLIPAIIHSRKSIRQTMILSSKSKVSNIIWLTLGLVCLIITLVCLLLFRHNERSYVSLILLISILLTTVLLSPYIVYILTKGLSLLFKKVAGFKLMYVKNNTLTSSVSMIVRLTSFGMIVFLLLNLLPTIANTALYSEADRMNYDLILSSLPDNKNEVVDYIKSIDHVDHAYKIYFSKEADITTDRSTVVIGLEAEEILSQYGSYILGGYDEVAQRISNVDRPYMLIGESYRIFNDVQIGDIVTVDLEGRVTNFVIAGYVNVMEQVNNLMIFNIEHVNKIYNQETANFVYMKLDNSDNYQYVYDRLISNRLTQSADINNYYQSFITAVDAISGVLVLVEGYSYIVMGLCFIAIAVAIVLSLKNNILQHKILSLLGMGKRLYLLSFMSLMGFILLVTAPLGILGTISIFNLLADVLLNFGLYFVFSVEYTRLFISATIAILLLLAISLWIANNSRKDFIPRMIIEEG